MECVYSAKKRTNFLINKYSLPVSALYRRPLILYMKHFFLYSKNLEIIKHNKLIAFFILLYQPPPPGENLAATAVGGIL